MSREFRNDSSYLPVSVFFSHHFSLFALSLVSSDVQSLFCFPRFSHFRSSCLNFARLSEIRARPMIDCRVSFENILDSLDYVIDLHHRISGSYSFHVQTPTEQHHFVSLRTIYYLASSSTWAFLSRTHRHSVTIKGIH